MLRQGMYFKTINGTPYVFGLGLISINQKRIPVLGYSKLDLNGEGSKEGKEPVIVDNNECFSCDILISTYRTIGITSLTALIGWLTGHAIVSFKNSKNVPLMITN